jgi:hypothetical protein
MLGMLNKHAIFLITAVPWHNRDANVLDCDCVIEHLKLNYNIEGTTENYLNSIHQFHNIKWDKHPKPFISLK